MSDLSIFDKFPVLNRDLEIHLKPQGGTLFLKGSPLPLTAEQAEFLQLCDGTRKIMDITPTSWSETAGDVKFLLLVAHLLNNGSLLLQERKSNDPVYPRVTGSKTAHLPPHMSLELTTGCNLRCRHCYRESNYNHSSHMPTEKFFQVARQLAAAGLRSVELTGGEPFVHEQFRDILDFCAATFNMVGVLTNGTILTEEICRTFVAMGDRLVLSISLDGSNPDIHDERRGVAGAFQRTLDNMKTLARLGLRFRISMCVDQDNFWDIENTLLVARNSGAFTFSYTPVLPLGRGRDWASFGWNLDFQEVYREEKRLAEKYQGFLGTMPEEVLCDMETRSGCGAGYRTYCLDPHGNVRPCVTFGDDQFFMGNLLEQSIEQVFSHPLTWAFRELLPPSQETCQDCAYTLFCRYCSLRGLYASQKVAHCPWRQLPGVQRLLPYMRKSADDQLLPG